MPDENEKIEGYYSKEEFTDSEEEASAPANNKKRGIFSRFTNSIKKITGNKKLDA